MKMSLRGVRSTTKQSRARYSGLLRFARNDSPCRVGKGAPFDLPAWAKSSAPIAREDGRERPDGAHAATIRRTILPTLRRADEVIE